MLRAMKAKSLKKREREEKYIRFSLAVETQLQGIFSRCSPFSFDSEDVFWYV